MGCAQNSKAAQLPFFKICSAAQYASRVRWGAKQSRRCTPKRQPVQPLPGSSASKVENPVELVGPVRALNCDPRQSAGCSFSREAGGQTGEVLEVSITGNK